MALALLSDNIVVSLCLDRFAYHFLVLVCINAMVDYLLRGCIKKSLSIIIVLNIMMIVHLILGLNLVWIDFVIKSHLIKNLLLLLGSSTILVRSLRSWLSGPLDVALLSILVLLLLQMVTLLLSHCCQLSLRAKTAVDLPLILVWYFALVGNLRYLWLLADLSLILRLQLDLWWLWWLRELVLHLYYLLMSIGLRKYLVDITGSNIGSILNISIIIVEDIIMFWGLWLIWSLLATWLNVLALGNVV